MNRRAKMQVSMSTLEYDAIYRYCQANKITPSKFIRETTLAEIEAKMRLVFVDDCQGIAPTNGPKPTLSELIAILASRI